MSASSTETLITGALTDYGASALVILGVVVGLMVGYIAFKFGAKWIKRVFRG